MDGAAGSAGMTGHGMRGPLAAPLISGYALIGDCRTAALVSSEGSIDWLCLPNFSGPSVFARLLDPGWGAFSLCPSQPFTLSRRYVDGTAVLETTFVTAAGSADVFDCLPVLDRIAYFSAGIAHSQGVPDGALGRDEMLVQIGRIARAVPVPVTADVEDGYGARAEDVAVFIAAAVEAGLAGGNIEDSGVDGDPAMIDMERACDCVRVAREAITQAGRPLVLNARTDPYLAHRDDGSAEENFAEAVACAGLRRRWR